MVRPMLRRLLTGYTTPLVLIAVSAGLIAAERAEGVAWSVIVIALAALTMGSRPHVGTARGTPPSVDTGYRPLPEETEMRLFKRKTEVDDTPRCPSCRERVPDGADECAMCGRDLTDLEAARDPRDEGVGAHP